MVCYAIPLAASILHAVTRKKISSWRNNVHHFWLNLLFIGGAIFGVVDHMWNGELLLVRENIGFDILLGLVISVIIYVVWIVVVTYDKSTRKIKIETRR
jgi:hypothetical protein